VNVRLAIPEDIPSIIELERLSPTAAHWSEEQYRHAIQGAGDMPERLVLVIHSDDSPRSEVKTHTLSPQKPEGQGWGTLHLTDKSHAQPAELGPCALAGFLVARHVKGEWELENIVVAPEFRRQGIGTQLLDALLARACETRSSTVFLEVRQSNRAARGLYQKAGFREAGNRKFYYSNPSEDAIVYYKDIA
jgi:ribosomal-protein-alanine acetyltransferase